MIIEICRFVLKGLLQTTADGSTRIMDYADDMTMAKLYEKFILGYYQREHPDIRAYSPQIAWQVTDGYRTLLPTMQSDIVLFKQESWKDAYNRRKVLHAQYADESTLYDANAPLREFVSDFHLCQELGCSARRNGSGDASIRQDR